MFVLLIFTAQGEMTTDNNSTSSSDGGAGGGAGGSGRPLQYYNNTSSRSSDNSAPGGENSEGANVGVVALDDLGEYSGTSSRFLELVGDFTRYALHLQLDLVEQPWCNEGDQLNATLMAFNEHLNSCPSGSFSPRWLSVQQISWKNVRKDAAKKHADGAGINGTTNSSSSSSSFSKSINFTAVPPSAEKNKTKDIIHKFLAFTVLLPKHPFSSDLLRSLLTVGPMFPSVSFVTGTGYEFRDMCTQYNVRSFPQILFFKVRGVDKSPGRRFSSCDTPYLNSAQDGLLKGRFDGDHTPERLAQKLAEWTQMFPRAYPSTTSGYDAMTAAARKLLAERPVRWWSIPPTTVLFSFSVLGRDVTARWPYAAEPVMGTLESLVPYDSAIVALSGLYVLARLAYILVSRRGGGAPVDANAVL